MSSNLTSAQKVQQRLAALAEYEIMDTQPEKAFDNLTYLANYICGTPVSLITLLDDKRQWFKSRRGVPISQTPIEQAFCAHAIQQPELMVVPDATEDDRLRNNPLVTGDPKIRFYAGAPLRTPEGVPLGTICVIDRVPHTMTSEQREALTALSEQATQLLALRRTIRRLIATTAEKNAAVDETEILKSLLPICAYCKKVRDDQHYWHQLENYYAAHAPIQFSHGICPDCFSAVKKELAKTEASPVTN